MSEQGCEQLTLFQEDSRASRFPPPGSDEARRMTAIYGRKCLESYPTYGHVGLLEKMLLESSIWRSTRCWLTWRIKATKQGRLYCQLVASMPRIDDTESPYWPTPTTQDSRDGSKMRKEAKGRHAMSLNNAVAMWPTPNASSGTGPGHPDSKQGAENLQTVVGGTLNPTWVEWLMGFPIGWTDLDA